MTTEQWLANNLSNIIVFICISGFLIYVLTAILLYSTHKKIYGADSRYTMVPGLQLYLLAKLAVNKLVGIIYSVLFVGIGYYLLTDSGIKKWGEYVKIFCVIYLLITIFFYIRVIIKNRKLEKGTLSPLVACLQCESMSFKKIEEPDGSTGQEVDSPYIIQK